MVNNRLPEWLGSEPDEDWYAPEARAVLERVHSLALALDLSDEELLEGVLDDFEKRRSSSPFGENPSDN